MAKYGLTGKFFTAPENRDKLAEILISASELMANADGCYLYIVHTDTKDNTAVWVTEVWESQSAHDNSLSVEGVGELISQARPLLTGAPEQHILTTIGGHGLD